MQRLTELALAHSPTRQPPSSRRPRWQRGGRGSADAEAALVKRALEETIDSIDGSRASEDVQAFVRPSDLPMLDVWGRHFSHAQAGKPVE